MAAGCGHVSATRPVPAASLTSFSEEQNSCSGWDGGWRPQEVARVARCGVSLNQFRVPEGLDRASWSWGARATLSPSAVS